MGVINNLLLSVGLGTEPYQFNPPEDTYNPPEK